MKVLGIHDSHNCGASLVEDGIVIADIRIYYTAGGDYLLEYQRSIS